MIARQSPGADSMPSLPSFAIIGDSRRRTRISGPPTFQRIVARGRRARGVAAPGPNRGRYFLLPRKKLSAREACNWAWFSEVVPRERLVAAPP